MSISVIFCSVCVSVFVIFCSLPVPYERRRRFWPPAQPRSWVSGRADGLAVRQEGGGGADGGRARPLLSRPFHGPLFHGHGPLYLYGPRHLYPAGFAPPRRGGRGRGVRESRSGEPHPPSGGCEEGRFRRSGRKGPFSARPEKGGPAGRGGRNRPLSRGPGGAGRVLRSAKTIIFFKKYFIFRVCVCGGVIRGFSGEGRTLV